MRTEGAPEPSAVASAIAVGTSGSLLVASASHAAHNAMGSAFSALSMSSPGPGAAL